jgi:shikimate dehydrogenase
VNTIGLIGYPLSHSKSPELFHEIFDRNGLSDWEYKLFPLSSIGELSNLLNQEQNLVGFNVTIPYKEQILPFLSSISPEADHIGAVNTVTVNGNTLTGHNTDAFGFEKSLNANNIQPKNCLILGTGGASKAVDFVLQKMSVGIQFASRKTNEGHLNYTEITGEMLSEFDTIVNTTPLGMHPNLDSAPDLPYKALNQNQTLVDLVYNPKKTEFLKRGELAGCQTLNGIDMLRFQAEKAWALFSQ